MANIRLNRNAFPLSLQPRTADPDERKKGEREKESWFDIAIWPLTVARPAFGARCTTNVNRKATRVHRVDKGVTRAGTTEQSRGTFIIIICSPCVSTCKPNARLVYFLSFPLPSVVDRNNRKFMKGRNDRIKRTMKMNIRLYL